MENKSKDYRILFSCFQLTDSDTHSKKEHYGKLERTILRIPSRAMTVSHQPYQCIEVYSVSFLLSLKPNTKRDAIYDKAHMCVSKLCTLRIKYLL